MPDLEAIGDAATGGILARAVEPNAGEAGGHTHERNCLNCGCALAGAYCHCCGQQAHVHRTLGAFFHDLLHGVLHFEGKIWRTLPMLAWRPGELTRRYIEGQRARFLSPVALFLFSVFLMFAIINLTGGPLDFKETPASRAQANMEYEKSRADSLNELRELERQRADAVRKGEATSSLDQEIAEVRRAMEIQTALFESLGATARVERSSEEPVIRPANPAVGAPEVRPIVDVDVSDVKALSWFDRAYRKAKENPTLLFYKVQNNAYKFSWALIPISVPFVWLLFLHRRRYRRFKAYDHTVFVTYSLAFMTLAFIVLSLLDPLPIPGRLMLLAMVLLPPIHMYRQLRGAYLLSRFSALWRTAALLIFAMIASGIFLTLLLMLGVLG